MESFESVNIDLEEPASTYYSGQLLTGRVHLRETEAVAAINITYIGQATVDWTDYESRENSGSVQEAILHYQGREMYFNVTESLFGGNGPTQLPPGTHTFPFQFQIPPNAPSTFKSSSEFKGTGAVFYSIIVQIVYNPSRMKETTKEFQVVAPLDLNKARDIVKNPLALELESTVSCLCTPRLINVRVSLPHGGFCPGQDIPIAISSQNDANVEIKGMVFTLVQREWYRSQTPASEMSLPETVLATTKSGPVLSGSKQEVTRRLKIPDMVAINLQNCLIIDLEYYLKVKVKISGCTDDMKDTTELVIGMVPLSTSENAQSYVHPCKEQLPRAPIPDIVNMPQTLQTVVTPNLSAVKSNQSSFMPNFGSNVPYPGSTSPNPVSAAPYPVSASPYPSYGTPYPGTNAPPSAAPPYPVTATPYPNSASPYPISATPYPVPNPNLNSATNFPMPNPNPTSNSSLRTGTLGFMAPNNSNSYVPYPMGNDAHSPLLGNRENTAPSAPPPPGDF